MEERMLTPDQAAKFMSLSKSCLNQWRMAGKGPKYIKLGARKVLYRESDLIAFLNRHTCGGEVANG